MLRLQRELNTPPTEWNDYLHGDVFCPTEQNQPREMFSVVIFVYMS